VSGKQSRNRANPERDPIDPLVVADIAGWDKLRGSVDVVVDPFVLRVAELFLAEPGSRTQDADAEWQVIERNVDALIAFFDAVVLYDRIPVFDYWITWDHERKPDEPLPVPFLGLAARNRVLPVTLKREACEDIKLIAMAKAKSAQIDEQVAQEIDEDLATTGWRWKPDRAAAQGWRFGGDDVAWETTDHPDELENRVRRLRNVVRGFEIFHGYGAMLGVDYILPPRRARQLLQARYNLRAKTEDTLFAELRRHAAEVVPDSESDTSVYDVARRPSFLALVVDELVAEHGTRVTPQDLLTRAQKVRGEPNVKAYRKWWRDLGPQLEAGRRPPAEMRTMRAVQEKLAKSLQPPRALPIEVSMTVSPAELISFHASASFELPNPRLLEGRRHRAVLLRMERAAQQMTDLVASIEAIWQRH
jgi:hypothetical protein